MKYVLFLLVFSISVQLLLGLPKQKKVTESTIIEDFLLAKYPNVEVNLNETVSQIPFSHLSSPAFFADAGESIHGESEDRICQKFMDVVSSSACSRQQFSCKGRCGEDITNGTACACDAYCQVYQDCCWDFPTQCPHQANVYNQELSPHLANMTVECLNSNAIISGCSEFPAGDQRLDEWKPVITSGKKLHFIKTDSSICNEKLMSFNSSIVYWEKLVKIYNDDVEAFGTFLRTGHSSMSTQISDIIPSGLSPRACKPTIQIECDSTSLCSTGNGKQQHLESTLYLCEKIRKESSQETLSFSNLEYENIGPAASTPGFGFNRDFISPCEVTMNQNETQSSIENFTLFSVLSFSHSGTLTVLPMEDLKSHGISLQEKTYLDCKMGQSQDIDNCVFTPVCQRGMSLFGLKCVLPDQLVVYVYGSKHFEHLNLLFEEITSCLDYFSSFMSNSGPHWKQISRYTGTLGITGYLDISPGYDLPVTDGRLNVTDFVMDVTNNVDPKKLADIPDSHSVMLCYVFKRVSGPNGRLTCDVLNTEAGKLTLVTHFSMKGTGIPKLSGQIGAGTDTKTSTAVANGGHMMTTLTWSHTLLLQMFTLRGYQSIL